MGTDEGSAKAPVEALQFDRVEALPGVATRACPRCQRPIGEEYFEAQQRMLCRACGEELGQGKGGAAWLRALAYGAGAATAGTLVWFLIIKLFHTELGLVAIAVGFLVGFAVRAGSRGRGGWRYQALAVALTYVSITASYVPMVVEGIRQGAEEDAAREEAASKAPAATPVPPAESRVSSLPAPLRLVVAFGFVLALALASPFLAGASNLMGLVIIGIALYEAWKLNRRVPVSGPFRLGQAPLAAPP